MDRKQRERDYHNTTFAEAPRARGISAYQLIHDSRAFFEASVRRLAAGARVLEYGSGPTARTSMLAASAREIVGIDLSEVAVQAAAERARSAGLNASYRVMDAETLDFPDQSFDLVASVAVLHHLDLDRAYGEIARVLKPSGHAVFMEPLGHNPFINLYRWVTPNLRTPDEHPLFARDLALASKYFGEVEVRYYTLLTMFAMPFARRPLFPKVFLPLERADRFLFEHAPWTRKYAWQVVMVMSKPKAKPAA